MLKSDLLGTLLLAGLVGLAPGRAVHAQKGDDPGPTLPRLTDLAPVEDPTKVPVITSVALDPAGKLLASAGDDRLVRIWDVQEEKVLRRLTGHRSWVRVAVFGPRGDTLATAGDDRRINFYEGSGEKGDKSNLPRSGPEGASHKLDLSPFSGQQPSRSVDIPGVAIYALAFSPDGKWLAAAGFDEKVRVYAADSGELVRALDGPGRDIRALAFSPDGVQLAAAGRTGRIRLWQSADGTHIRDLEGHRRRVHALVYSPDSSVLASAGDDRVIRLWSAATGAALEPLPGLPCKVRCLAFCGEGRLASGGTDNVIRVWDLVARRQQRELSGHTGSVVALAWDASSRTLVSGSFDTTVRFWRLGEKGADRVSKRPAAVNEHRVDR